jgi:hypothetical protein
LELDSSQEHEARLAEMADMIEFVSDKIRQKINESKEVGTEALKITTQVIYTVKIKVHKTDSLYLFLYVDIQNQITNRWT